MTGKAVVFGGGGVTGVAWMSGLLAGWRAAGLELGDADLIVGTSAGSVVAANLAAGCDLDELYRSQLEGPGAERAARMDLRQWLKVAPALVRIRHSASARAAIGRMALAADTMPEQDRRAIIAARLPVRDWPDRRLLITAVAAGTGEFRAFDRASDVALVDAVAASCAVPGVWPPVTIGDQRWIDGGMRSDTNADLAAGYQRVLVVAPLRYGARREVRRLGRSADVVLVQPDPATRHAIGRNLLDPARRGPAARAGHAQAATTQQAVRELWCRE